MRLFSRLFLLSSFVYTFGVLAFVASSQQESVQAETNHVVISQIQISGSTDNDDEFVELYNPTDATIDLAGWRLSKDTASATTSADADSLVSSLSGSIAPRSYFLITSNESLASTSADLLYSNQSQHIASDNVIYLFSDSGQIIVDKVGLEDASDFEGTAFPDNPADDESIVRKATEMSTEESLSAGGSEATLGNGYDTDNNAADFILFNESMPRNSESSIAEPMPTATPTTEPTAVPSDEPTPTIEPTATPTVEPTATPTIEPTETPAPTPTNTPMPTATPTMEPTVTPTEVPTPTAEPTITVTPTQTMTPTPTPEVIVNEPFTNNRRFICIQTYRTFSIFGMQFSIPRISCDMVRI